MMHTLILTVAVLGTSAAALAENAQPYAGQEARAIKALPDNRIEKLREGAGLGYALTAELNGWPGPLHVLEMADELGLDRDTRAKVEAIYIAMKAEAQALGTDLIAAEAALEVLFAEGTPEAAAVSEATATIAEIEGRLRAAHLVAHLKTTPLLSRHQRMAYIRARGYAAGHDQHHGHGNN